MLPILRDDDGDGTRYNRPSLLLLGRLGQGQQRRGESRGAAHQLSETECGSMQLSLFASVRGMPRLFEQRMHTIPLLAARPPVVGPQGGSRPRPQHRENTLQMQRDRN